MNNSPAHPKLGKSATSRHTQVGGSSAFTLVELLVVIAIIGILAGLLLPNVTDAMRDAKVAKAKTRLSSMQQAIQSFESEYGYYPTGLSETPLELTGADAKSFVEALTGLDNTGSSVATWGNRKRMRFMTFNNDEKKYLEGGDASGTPLDGANGNIFVVVDSDNDGVVSLPPALNLDETDKYDSDELSASVALWSLPPSGDFTSDTAVTSFQLN